MGTKKAIGLFLGFVALVSLLGLFLNYFDTSLGWMHMPAEKLKVQNVEREYNWFYQMHQSLRASKATLRSLTSQRDTLFTLHGKETARWPFDARSQYEQISKQLLQVETAYNSACGDYTAKWNNVFHNIAAPRDIPKDCALVE